MTNINFDSKNLKVNYLSLNLQFNNPRQIQGIADYLANTFSCRSTLLDQYTKTKTKKTLVETDKNNYSAKFIVNSNKHWRGMTLCFKRNSAQWFYKNMKYQKLDWIIFNLEYTNLGRIDLCYDRKLKATDTDPHLFLENSYKNINSKNENRQAKIGNNILWVRKRSSSNFFRVYPKPDRKKLRFEIEVKKDGVKKFQHDLFTGQFDRFEEFLTEHFYHQAIKLFGLENSYCNWLRANFRQVRKLPAGELLINYLSTSYLTEKPSDDLAKVEFFYQLIQLLNYVKSLEGSSKSILMGDRTYQVFQFPVNHFLEFIGKPRNNNYQIKKLVKFLESLQDIKPIIEYFSDGGFRGYVAFPYLKIERKQSWWVEFSICQELYLYRYPFHLPERFLNYQDNFELKVKFSLL